MPKPAISLEGMTPEQIQGLAGASAMLLNNPKTRSKLERLIKEADPEYTSPELELQSAIENGQAGTLKEIETLKNTLAERDARAKWDQLKSEPIKQGLIEESELPKLETYMKEQGFNATQYMQAARLYRHEMQSAEPTNSAGMSPMTLPNEGNLRKNPAAWGRETAFAAINELRGKRSLTH